jgi:hypothetical protein
VRRAGLGEGGVDLLLGGDVDLAEHAAQFLGERFALLRVEVEQRDLHAVAGQAARGGGPQAGGAAGDDGGNTGIELHLGLSPD